VTGLSGSIDYLCNAFTPDRQQVWDDAIAGQGVPIKVRRDPTDSFCTVDTMIERMDELGIATLVMTAGDLHKHGTPFEYDPVAARPDEMQAMADAYPGRFVGWWAVNPLLGMAGVRRAAEILATREWAIGLWIHTHSFDRRFDHPDYYPYYALCAEHDVPIAMQAGTSGGLMPSECGQPIGIDRPAIYFPEVNFLLSHTGWPWVDETVAMALKFSNVYLGTGAYPPKHWDPAVHAFIRGPGKRKVIFGTNFPTVGHRHVLSQINDMDLADATRANLLEDNARRLFTRLGKQKVE
jgi:predicted TIM-barrel fold metal-dependent hydrolase